MGILISHLVPDFGGLKIGAHQQLLRLFHPHPCEIFHKGHSHLLAEDGAEIAGAYIDPGSHRVQGNLLLGVIIMDKRPGLVQNLAVLAGCLAVP